MTIVTKMNLVVIIHLLMLVSIDTIPISKKNVRSPLIITNDDNIDDYYYSDLKYKSDDPKLKTSYTVDALNSFVIPYLLGFNSNPKNMTTQKLASQVFLLAYGILLKAIDNRLYENNKIFVENIIRDQNGYFEASSDKKNPYPRSDYESVLDESSQENFGKKFFFKLSRLNTYDSADNNDSLSSFQKFKNNALT